MKSKNKPYSIKKAPYYLSLSFLTAGASLILGFLSFSGMYALFPVLSLAAAGFALSVAYEGEIYLQNIKGALTKLFKTNYLEHYLARRYLLEHFPENTGDANCPQFFKDYTIQLHLLHKFGHKSLNEASRARKKQVEKTLSDMEKWFAQQLFASADSGEEEHDDVSALPSPTSRGAMSRPEQLHSDYTKHLRDWLNKNQRHPWQERLNNRSRMFTYVKLFSLLAGFFMGLGTTYLIVEAFSVIPFFAAIPFVFWPVIILPMAVIAGAAYGFLTYNSVTDLINNNTLKKWYDKLRTDWQHGFSLRNLLMTTTAVLLLALAVALTVCTAGTWWTVAKNARPLFDWMRSMPSFIMGVINPVITGFSAIFFNVQNTAESLEMVDNASRSEEGIVTSIKNYISKAYEHVRATENWLQIVNPFRMLLKIIITPLRVLLFIGHLISIGVTADRMPGIPEMVAALVAIISEGFEDAHYFIGHSHGGNHQHDPKTLLKERLALEHGHNHNADIPTVVLKTLASPVYFLAASWDYLSSKLNPTNDAAKKPVTFVQAWNKQRGLEEEQEVTLKPNAKRPSAEWQIEHSISLIEQHKTKHLSKVAVGSALAQQKASALTEVQAEIRKTNLLQPVTAASSNPVFNQHRWFSSKEDTTTKNFLDDLPERVNLRG